VKTPSKQSSRRHRRTPPEVQVGSATPERIARLRRLLLGWGQANRRDFYWREPGVTPFGILVTEVLVARTRAESVDPVVRRLMQRFPSPARLAAARHTVIARILRPLGLHRTRARLLVRCAKMILSEHSGIVPSSVDHLITLPYVGRYAANAVASVAFEQRRAVLDANVARIYRRVFSIPVTGERLTVAEGLWEFADRALSKSRPRDFNWAILDLGGMVCTPRSPACAGCPLAVICDAKRGLASAASSLAAG